MDGRVSGLVPFVLVLLAACSLDNPAYDDTEAASTAASVSATATATATSTGATTTANTASTSTSSAETTSSTTAATATTSSATSTDATTDATTDAITDGSTTEPPPEPTRLQHYVGGQCLLPFWCFSPDIWTGQAHRMFAQECFTAPFPSFRITRIGYQIMATRGIPSNPQIELHGFDGIAPSPAPIAPPTPLADDNVAVGYHSIPLDYELNTQSFCIGITAGDLGLNTGIGIAVDDLVPPIRQTFYRVEGQGPCNTGPPYFDVSQQPIDPKAQWCIDVDIIPL